MTHTRPQHHDSKRVRGIGGEAGKLDRQQVCRQNCAYQVSLSGPLKPDSPETLAGGASTPASPLKPRLGGVSSFLRPAKVPQARNTISCVCRSSSNARGTLPLDLPAPVTEHARKITRQPFGCAQICPPSAGATCCPGDGWGTSAARQAVGFRLVEAAGFKGARPFGTGWRHRSAA